MSRELENWLDSYMEYTDNTESPLSYHRWCGLAAISGSLQRKVYMQWGLGQTIYPNVYVVLVGPSGKTRKGVALGIAKDLLKDVPGVSIAPESSSGKEAMTSVMKRASVNFQDPTDNKIKFHCSIIAFSEELSVFLGQGNISYLSNLTDWYDSKDEWEYESIGRGKDKLNGVCLTLIGGTAPDWLQSMIPQEAVGGGFTSRVIFIVEEMKRKIVPEPSITDRELYLQGCLQRDLERINKMAGQIQLSKEAKDLYIAWYIQQDKNTMNGRPAIDDNRFGGYNERRATHIRKLMLLCSAARSDDMLIQAEDFHRAVEYLVDAEVNMAKTFGGLGRSRNSDITETIKNYIERVGITTRKTILSRFYRDVDAVGLNAIEETLRQMGCIKVELIIKLQDKKYEWVQGKVPE